MANNHNKYKNNSREELIDELETLKKGKSGLVWNKKNSQKMLDIFVNWKNVLKNFELKQFPTLKEIRDIIDIIKNLKYKLTISLTYGVKLQISEVVGSKTKNINLEELTIHPKNASSEIKPREKNYIQSSPTKLQNNFVSVNI